MVSLSSDSLSFSYALFLFLGTSDPSTMFRANTMDSTMFKYFAILVASPYLWEVVARFVWEIQKDGIVCSYYFFL